MIYRKFYKEYVKSYHILMYYAEKSRREGLLALEEEVSGEKGPEEFLPKTIMRTGMRLVIDGTDMRIIKKVLNNYISHKKGWKKKLAEIETAGIIEIAKGTNPRLIHYILESFVKQEPNSEIIDFIRS